MVISLASGTYSSLKRGHGIKSQKNAREKCWRKNTDYYLKKYPAVDMIT